MALDLREKLKSPAFLDELRSRDFSQDEPVIQIINPAFTLITSKTYLSLQIAPTDPSAAILLAYVFYAREGEQGYVGEAIIGVASPSGNAPQGLSGELIALGCVVNNSDPIWKSGDTVAITVVAFLSDDSVGSATATVTVE